MTREEWLELEHAVSQILMREILAGNPQRWEPDHQAKLVIELIRQRMEKTNDR